MCSGHIFSLWLWLVIDLEFGSLSQMFNLVGMHEPVGKLTQQDLKTRKRSGCLLQGKTSINTTPMDTTPIEGAINSKCLRGLLVIKLLPQK